MFIQKLYWVAACALMFTSTGAYADSITTPHGVTIGNQTYMSGEPLTLSDALEIGRWRNDEACERAWRNKGRYSSGFKQALAFLSDQEISYAATGSSGFLGKSHHLGRGTQALATSYNRINFALESLYLPGIQDPQCLSWYSGVRATQNLQLDIVRAYYRAAVAERAVTSLKPYFEGSSVSATIANSNRVEGVKLKSKFHDAQIEYKGALNDLRELLGLPSCFEVKLPYLTATTTDLIPFDLCAMENMALSYRPELKAIPSAYALSHDEVRACLASYSPYTLLFTGDIVDPNTFDSHLRDVWLRTSDALFLDILDLPCRCERGMISDVRTQIAMGVITQLHLSLLALSDAVSQHHYAQELYALESGQLEMGHALELREQPGSVKSGDYEIEKAMKDAGILRSWANVQIALYQLGNAVGCPAYFVEEGDCLNVSVTEEEEELYYEDYLLYCDECLMIQQALQERTSDEGQIAETTIYNRSPRVRVPHDRYGFMGDHESQPWEEHEYLEERRPEADEQLKSALGERHYDKEQDYDEVDHYNDEQLYPRRQTRLPSRYTTPPVDGVPPRQPLKR